MRFIYTLAALIAVVSAASEPKCESRTAVKVCESDNMFTVITCHTRFGQLRTPCEKGTYCHEYRDEDGFKQAFCNTVQ